MHNKLRTHIEILNRMLPDKDIISAFILDNADNPLVLDFLFGNPLLDINRRPAKRAVIERCVLVCGKLTTAGRTGKLCQNRTVCRGINQLMTNRTLCFLSFGLVINNGISTVGTYLRREFFRLYINNMPAGTGNLLLREDKIGSFNRVSTLRTFNNKFCHSGHTPD